MPKFNKSNIADFEAFLYRSSVHDAELESISYDCGDDCVALKLINPIFNIGYDMRFYNVETTFIIKNDYADWFGSKRTVNSITVEKDFSYLKNYYMRYSEFGASSIYLLIQLFSGSEVHVVFNDVIVETL